MRFYTTEQLSRRQSTTPEGYLLCEEVPIARTGSQIYAAEELPGILPDGNGLVRIVREEGEVFRPETIASFEGKPITIYHNFVDPENWKRLSVGIAQNVRRGDGADRDLLFADLLVTDQKAIEIIQSKKLREISCGYNAEYDQETPGIAYQRDIVGNHIAVVERGRAGPRCSIQDEGIDIMATANQTKDEKRTLFARIRKALRSGDAAAAIEEIAKTEDAEETEEEKTAREAEEKSKKTEDSVAKLQRSVDNLSKVVMKIADAMGEDPDEEDDPAKKKTGDEGGDLTDPKAAAKMEEGKVYDQALPDIRSRAEILVPGFSVPTTDSEKTLDALAAIKRKVLTDAMKTEDGKKAVSPLLAGRTVDALTADEVTGAFTAASEIARAQNNARGARHSATGGNKSLSMADTIADINRKNAEFYKSQV